MLTSEDAFALSTPTGGVFTALSDLRTVVECLPATRAVEITSSRHATANARVVFGKTTISFRGNLDLVASDAAAGSLSYRINAQEVRGKGRIDGRVDVRLRRSDDDQTWISVSGEAKASGRVAALRDEVVQRAADHLLRRFGEALQARLDNTAPSAPHPEVSGEVTVVTTEPVEMPHPDSAPARVRELLLDHRWLVPAAIVGTLGVIVAVRRRSS